MTGQEEDRKRSTPPKLSPALEAAPRLEPPVVTEPEVAPSKTDKLGKEHSDFATFHEGYIRHYITLADTKAGVIFALAAGIIGYLLNDDEIQATILAPSCSSEFVVPVLALASLGIVAALTFFVVAPRLSAPSDEGLVFFGAVAKKTSSDDFLSEIGASSDEQLIEARLKHCYDTATVCSQKYELLKAAIWLTPISLLFALFTLLAT
jgi:hypothetical protein